MNRYDTLKDSIRERLPKWKEQGKDLDLIVQVRYTVASARGWEHGAVIKGSWNGRPVAIKCVGNSHHGEEDLLNFFEDEVLAWKELRHPNLVPFYGLTTTGNARKQWPGFVFAWVEDNMDIARYLDDLEGVRARWCSELVKDTADGLAYLHSQGLTHGDLKPDNIMVTHTVKDDGAIVPRALICNFGFQRVIMALGATRGIPEHRYKAPECMCVGPPRDARQPIEMAECNDAWACLCVVRVPPSERLKVVKCSDVWSWSMTVLHLYSGKKPYDGEASGRLPHYTSTITEPLVLPSLPSDYYAMPEPVSTLMKACWVAEPKARPTAEKISLTLRPRQIAEVAIGSVTDDPPSGIKPSAAANLAALPESHNPAPPEDRSSDIPSTSPEERHAAGDSEAASTRSSATFNPTPERAFTKSDQLLPLEAFWRDMHGFLAECGYQLRPRYRPGWKASWKAEGATEDELRSEDGQQRHPQHIMDGLRVADGQNVIFKIIELGHYNDGFVEGVMNLYLCSGDLARDPQNHCLPVYEVLEIPERPDRRLIVMPMLRDVDDPGPPFDTIGEVVDCFKQIFEGVAFMHKHNLAHWDICETNIGMEPSMVLEPFHWCNHSKKFDWSGPVHYVTRTRRPPKYYLYDFGRSRWFPSPEDARMLPTKGGDYTLPELKTPEVPANPFAGDVYCAGNWLREEFMQKYRGLDFMEPLIKEMTQTDFTARPKMDVALDRLNEIMQSLSISKLRSPVRRRRELRLVSLLRAPSHWLRQMSYMREGLPAIPARKADAPFAAPVVPSP